MARPSAPKPRSSSSSFYPELSHRLSPAVVQKQSWRPERRHRRPAPTEAGFLLRTPTPRPLGPAQPRGRPAPRPSATQAHGPPRPSRDPSPDLLRGPPRLGARSHAAPSAAEARRGDQQPRLRDEPLDTRPPRAVPGRRRDPLPA